MTQLQKFIQKDKPRVDAKIYSYFNSFKQFICCNELPNFKIQYTDSRLDKSINYKAQISPYQKPIILKYNIAMLKENSDDFKTTLVHEFTHLYDYHIQSKFSNDDIIKRNLMLYTEFHASQIEVLFCYNIVDKITDIAKIYKVKNSEIIIDIPRNKSDIYKSNLIRFHKKKTLENFIALETSYMYFVGSVLIISHVMNQRKIPTGKFIEPYNKYMQQIVDILFPIRYDEIPSSEVLQQIGDLHNQILHIFVLKNNKK